MKKTLREGLEAAARKWAQQEAAGSETAQEAVVFGAEWWQRASRKALGQYERELTKAHEEVIGPVTLAIKIQIRKVARLWEKVDRLHDELDMESQFIRYGQGSTKQMTENIDPRLSILEKYERTLDAVLTSIGLTYNSTPSKITDDKRRGVDTKKDALNKNLENAKRELSDDVPEFDGM